MVLTGATGFVGSAVLRELTARPELRVRVVGRTEPPAQQDAAPVEFVPADLAEPGSLAGVCAGADVVVHAATYIGPDVERCRTVNQLGSARLVREAVEAGVGRLVLLSTAAVYGEGPHRGIEVDEVAPAPVSAVSRSRLAAEGEFRAAGGTVLRPGLVLGRGDRWVVPALAELVARVPARWEGGAGLHSVVAVDDLARLIVAVATSAEPVAGVHHASHPVPVSTGDLLDVLAAHGVLPPTEGDLPWDRCLEQLRSGPGLVSERQFSLLARDHWYRSEDVWRAARCDPGPSALRRVAEAADWYREFVHGRAGDED